MFEERVLLVRFCFNDGLKWKNFKTSVFFLVLNSYATLLAEVPLVQNSYKINYRLTQQMDAYQPSQYAIFKQTHSLN